MVSAHPHMQCVLWVISTEEVTQYLQLTTAEAKNEWSYTYTSLYAQGQLRLYLPHDKNTVPSTKSSSNDCLF